VSPGAFYRTDNGNPILDAKWPFIAAPESLEAELEAMPGVVCCGLFIGLCQAAYVARPGGVVARTLDSERRIAS
jgi:ribose 5-phosphate isomerase A